MTPELPSRAPEHIAEPLLAWFDRHGRHDLPWQHPRTPYRVWVAEIMLQQTQVTTVIGYFKAFMQRFPDIQALAAATEDDVMAHWAGLGYYARARHLRAAARQVISAYGGQLPDDVEQLMTLPGIGRSTAGAIVAQAYGIRAPILDGNAKRVMARLAGITATPSTAAYDKPLWGLAERYTPRDRVTDYTQAIMDLGAMICTRGTPACQRCPLAAYCVARQDGMQRAIPAPRRKRSRAHRTTTVLMIEDDSGQLLLEKRPPAGIWGGLWSLPEVPPEADVAQFCRDQLGLVASPEEWLAPVEHAFTHFLLTLHAQRMKFVETIRIMDGQHDWFRRDDRPGLPAPIARLVDSPQLKLRL